MTREEIHKHSGRCRWVWLLAQPYPLKARVTSCGYQVDLWPKSGSSSFLVEPNQILRISRYFTAADKEE